MTTKQITSRLAKHCKPGEYPRMVNDACQAAFDKLDPMEQRQLRAIIDDLQESLRRKHKEQNGTGKALPQFGDLSALVLFMMIADYI